MRSQISGKNTTQAPFRIADKKLNMLEVEETAVEPGNGENCSCGGNSLVFTGVQDLYWFSFLFRVHAVHEIHDGNQQEDLYLTFSFVGVVV